MRCGNYSTVRPAIGTRHARIRIDRRFLIAVACRRDKDVAAYRAGGCSSCA
jgi:hypothetical protein